MTEIHPQMLAFLFGITYDVIGQQTDDLTHEESLLQLPFRGNCLNWVLGHIIANRNRVLDALGEEAVWDDETAAPYQRESDPITPENAHIAQPLKGLLNDLETSHNRLIAALERATPEDLAVQRTERSTVGKWLTFLYFHEAYHTGQTELLRQLAGKDDKVIP